MTPLGERIIKQWEGLVLHVYPDTGKHPSGGWGHKLTDAECASMPIGTPVTMAQAERWFEADSQWVDVVIRQRIQVPINGHQAAALESLVYNAGPGVLCGTAPKLMAAIGRQDWPAAAHEFLDICHETDAETGERRVNVGLQNRRKAESALFLTPVTPDPLDPEQVLFSVGLSLHDMVRAIDFTPHHDQQCEGCGVPCVPKAGSLACDVCEMKRLLADTEPAPPPEFLPEDVG